MGDLRLELRLKNAELWRATVGVYGSVSAFCLKLGQPGLQSRIGQWLGLKDSPWRRTKKGVSYLSPTAARVCEFVGIGSDLLFPMSLYSTVTNPLIVADVDSRNVPLAYLSAGGKMIADPSPDPFDLVQREEMQSAIDYALNTLTKQEKAVVRERFGFNGGPQELAEVGKKFGISKERVRQIEAKALRKLRHPGRARILGPFRDIEMDHE